MIATAILPMTGCSSINVTIFSIAGTSFSDIQFAADASAGSRTFPSRSPMSPIVLRSCAILPSSVSANTLFMLPTFCVTTSASIAAFSSSVPYLRTSSCAAVNEIPTLLSAPVWPIIAFPNKFAILVASSAVALTPFCWTSRFSIAGSSLLTVDGMEAYVASCCAPDRATSSPTTPSFWSAAASFIVDCAAPSVAPILVL